MDWPCLSSALAAEISGPYTSWFHFMRSHESTDEELLCRTVNIQELPDMVQRVISACLNRGRLCIESRCGYFEQLTIYVSHKMYHYSNAINIRVYFLLRVPKKSTFLKVWKCNQYCVNSFSLHCLANHFHMYGLQDVKHAV